MSLALSGADAAHLAAAAGLTYALGFERALRGAAAGQGRLLIALAATALCVFVLEIRHIPWLSMLDSRHWAGKLGDDEAPPDRGGGPVSSGDP